MPTTKENYQISGNDLSGVVARLNFVLARIADRLDKIEGLRNELETEGATFSGSVRVTKGTAQDTSSVYVEDADSVVLHRME